jgi:protocatechuate 3,4-dioxygenase alpha subunit
MSSPGMSSPGMTTEVILTATPGQTVGPFYGYALPYPGGDELVPPGRADAIRLHGTVYDGAGNPVPDALIEIWQADGNGDVPHAEGSLERNGWTFTGFGRAAVDGSGHYSFTTVRPGPTEAGAASFFAMTVFARGLLNRLFTRVYLPEDEDALAGDPLLASVPENRRATLVAHPDADGYAFDVRLQGEGETVFLAFPGS